jgi:hypothetical protein
MCGLLFDVAAEALRTIAADPRHLGAQIGAALVLHTWDSALTRHPHVHGVVPGDAYRRGRCVSLVNTPRLPIPLCSRSGSYRCAHANGWCMPGGRSRDQKRCARICRATRIG